MADNPFPKNVLIVIAEIDAECEADWNRWYDEVHLPDALACPGVIAGQRFKSSGQLSLTDHGERDVSATVSYATLYEVSGPEALETPEFKAMAGWYDFTGKIKARTQVFRAL